MKQTPWVVMMPEGWKPDVCGLCSMNHACHANYSIKINCIERCPLANAKKAVYSGYADSLGAHMIATPKGKALTLYAAEMEEGK